MLLSIVSPSPPKMTLSHLTSGLVPPYMHVHVVTFRIIRTVDLLFTCIIHVLICIIYACSYTYAFYALHAMDGQAIAIYLINSCLRRRITRVLYTSTRLAWTSLNVLLR